MAGQSSPFPFASGSPLPGEARIVAPLAAVVALALVIVGAAVYVASAGQDKVQRRAEERAAGSVVRGLARAIAGSVRDHSAWDDAVRNLVLDLDPAWADNNVGPYVLKTFGYDASFVVGPDERVLYGHLDGARTDAALADVLGPAAHRLVTRAREEAAAAVAGESRPAPSAVLAVPGGAYVAAASPVVPEEGSALVPLPGPPAVLVLADRIDEAFLRGLAADFGLSRLRVEPPGGGRRAEAAADLAGPDGEVAARLVWEPRRPGRPWRAWLIPALLGALLVFALFSGLALRRLRLATEALRESEERLRLAVEATGLGTWDVDPVARVHRWSDQFRAIMGLGPGARPDPELFASLIHPDDRDWVYDRYRRAYTPEGGGRYEAEFRVLRANDGAERWVLAAGRIHFDAAGRALRGIGTLMDVTERRRSEEACRESEERYRTLLETSPEAVVVQQDGRIVVANHQAANLLGAQGPDELVGRSIFSLIDDTSLPASRARIERLNAPGARNELAEFTFRRLDGTPIIVESASAAVLLDGRLAMQAAFRDVSARKAAEANQRLLLQELSHRVKNTLAVVQGIATRSLTGDRSPSEAREAFSQRLRALANTHTLLTAANWLGADLRRLAEAELAPYGGRRARLSGPDLTLTPRAAVSLGLVLHELATNAAKHGALSVPEGRVGLAWSIVNGTFRLRWTERDGPAVRPPETHGFGRTLVERAACYELGARARLEFRPEGVTYDLEAALDSIVVVTPKATPPAAGPAAADAIAAARRPPAVVGE